MGKNKMIAKSCPKCEMQVAVASKSCKCGHTFFLSRRGADSLPAAEDMKRRTGRVRRSQPQFYDAQHYQKQVQKRSPKKRSLSRSLDDDFKGKDKETAAGRARRRRALRRAGRAPRAGGSSAERGREPAPPLRPAQLARCSLILAEINRKIGAVACQPPARYCHDDDTTNLSHSRRTLDCHGPHTKTRTTDILTSAHSDVLTCK